MQPRPHHAVCCEEHQHRSKPKSETAKLKSEPLTVQVAYISTLSAAEQCHGKVHLPSVRLECSATATDLICSCQSEGTAQRHIQQPAAAAHRYAVSLE